MNLNFKKSLLTCTALVAVSVAHTGAANAQMVLGIDNQTVLNSFTPIQGYRIQSGSGTYINLDLENADGSLSLSDTLPSYA